MKWPVGALGLVAVLGGCGSSSARPCGREMDAVRQRESLRIHGLTQNDDVHEAMNRLQSAARCAREEDFETLRVHAFLLRSRLEARGATDDLIALNELLSAVGAVTESPDQVRRGPDAARRRLVDYATAMRAAAGADADAQLRAHLASLALEPDHTEAFPRGTRALVNHDGASEGCFTVINYQELPAGTAVISLRRAGAAVALYGESTTFGVSKGKPRVIRLCTAGGLRNDDMVQVSVGGQAVWEQKLVVTADDVVRGALRRSSRDGGVPASCADAKEHSARVACALLTARGAP